MVKFGLPVFLRFGLMVKNSAFWFSYNSAFRIRPNGPVRWPFGLICPFVFFFIYTAIWLNIRLSSFLFIWPSGFGLPYKFALVLLSQSKLLQGFLLKLILGWIYAVSFALFLKVIKSMHCTRCSPVKVVWALLHCKGCRCGLTWFDMEWLDMDMEQNGDRLSKNDKKCHIYNWT